MTGFLYFILSAIAIFMILSGLWYWLWKLKNALPKVQSSISRRRRSFIVCLGLSAGVIVSVIVLGVSREAAIDNDAGMRGIATAIEHGTELDSAYAASLWDRASSTYDSALVEVALDEWQPAESLLTAVTRSRIVDSALLAKAHSMLGLVHRFQDADSLAVQDYSTALKFDPTSTTALAGLVISHVRNKDLRAAGEAMKRLLTLPGDITVLYFQGLAYAELGDSAAALRSLDKAIKLKQDYRAATLLRDRIQASLLHKPG